MRRPVSIATCFVPPHGFVRTVICDDGTIWECDGGNHDWQTIAGIPQPSLEHGKPLFTLVDDAPKADAEGWIEWSGGSQPVANDVKVEVKCRNGIYLRDKGSLVHWFHSGNFADIIAYRLISETPQPEALKIQPPCNGEIPSLYTPTEWPEGAEWWAVDGTQLAWFYEAEPELDKDDPDYDRWFSRGPNVECDESYIRNTIPDWKTSKRRRPQPSTTEAEIA